MDDREPIGKSDRREDGEIQSVLDSIRRLVQALREASRRSEINVGVTAAQLFVLEALAHGQSLSIKEVAQYTRTHQSSVSVVVQRLAERGLVERHRSPVDARRQEVSLTRAGRRLLHASPDPAQHRLIHAIAALPPRRRRDLARSLQEIAAAMIPGEAPPPMFFEEEAAGPSKDD